MSGIKIPSLSEIYDFVTSNNNEIYRLSEVINQKDQQLDRIRNDAFERIAYNEQVMTNNQLHNNQRFQQNEKQLAQTKRNFERKNKQLTIEQQKALKRIEKNERIARKNQYHNNQRFQQNEKQLAQTKRDFEKKNKQLTIEQQKALKRIKKNEQKLQEQHSKINILNSEIRKFKDKEKNSEAYAEQWLDNMKRQLEILEHLELNRFFHDMFKNYTAQIQNMQNNLNNEQFQACTALAQNWHTQIETQLGEIEDTYKSGKFLEVELEDSFKQLEKLMNVKTIEREFEMEDGEKEIETIKIDFWAEDEWKECQKSFAQIQSSMQQIGKMNLSQMKNIDNAMEEFIKKLNETHNKAENRFINNIRKMELQESIADKLSDRGFEVKDNIYQNNDERNNNILLMENERSEKILINIGEENEKLKMEVDFNTLNPLTHNQRLKNILQAIGTEDYKEVPGYENKPAEEERFDLKNYQKKR